MNADSIQYVLEELGSPKVKNLGRNVQASCPLSEWNHGSPTDDKMKLGVKVTDGISPANCFYPGCFHGTLMDLVDKVAAKRVAAGEWELGGEVASNLKAFILLAEETDEVTYDRDQQVADPVQDDVLSLLGSGSDYWESRGINRTTQDVWKLGEGLGRAFIPIIAKDGTVIGMKGRLLPGEDFDRIKPGSVEARAAKFRMLPPNAEKSKVLVGEHLLTKPVDFMLVVESELDAILLNQWLQDPKFREALPYGMATDGAVAVATGGGEFSDDQVQRMVEHVGRQGEVAIGFDTDHAGRLATRKLIDKLKKRLPRITEVEWVLKDPSDTNEGVLTLDQVQSNALSALTARQEWFGKRVKALMKVA